MEKRYYPVVMLPDDEGYIAAAPDVECYTQGGTLDEAIFMIHDAIGLMLEDHIRQDLPLPEPSRVEEIDISKVFTETDFTNAFIMKVEFDPNAYLRI